MPARNSHSLKAASVRKSNYVLPNHRHRRINRDAGRNRHYRAIEFSGTLGEHTTGVSTARPRSSAVQRHCRGNAKCEKREARPPLKTGERAEAPSEGKSASRTSSLRPNPIKAVVSVLTAMVLFRQIEQPPISRSRT